MKSPIIFRASFQQPKESTFKVPGSIVVEVYHARVASPQEWKARRPGTRIDFPHIAAQSTASTLQRQIELLHFEKRLTDWEAFDRTQEPPRLLKREDWHTDPQGNTTLTVEYQDKLKAEETARGEKLIQERKARALEGM